MPPEIANTLLPCVAALTLVCLLLPQAAEASFRCDGKIVKRGDRPFEVRQRCGEPDAIVPLHTVYTVQHGHVPTREEWQYNFGPHRLMRFLVFQNGRLSQDPHRGARLSRQSRGPLHQPAQHRAGHVADGAGWLAAGSPESRELRITQSSYRLDRRGTHYRRGLPAEDWIYDFGSNRFMRIVTLINGRVVNIERSSTRGSSN
jgi:hypothetical protein